MRTSSAGCGPRRRCGMSWGKGRSCPSESPLLRQEHPKHRGAERLLLRRECGLAQQVAGLEAGVEPKAPPGAAREAKTGDRISRARLDRHEVVPVQILAELEL